MGQVGEVLDLDPGPGETVVEAPGFAVYVFVAVYEPDGALRYGFTLPGLRFDRGAHVAYDEGGTLYLAATANNPVDLDPGPGEAVVDGFTSPVLASYTPDGALRWGFALEGAQCPVEGVDVAGGRVALACSLISGTLDVDPGPTERELDGDANITWLAATYASADGALASAFLVGGSRSFGGVGDVALDAEGGGGARRGHRRGRRLRPGRRRARPHDGRRTGGRRRGGVRRRRRGALRVGPRPDAPPRRRHGRRARGLHREPRRPVRRRPRPGRGDRRASPGVRRDDRVAHVRRRVRVGVVGGGGGAGRQRARRGPGRRPGVRDRPVLGHRRRRPGAGCGRALVGLRVRLRRVRRRVRPRRRARRAADGRRAHPARGRGAPRVAEPERRSGAPGRGGGRHARGRRRRARPRGRRALGRPAPPGGRPPPPRPRPGRLHGPRDDGGAGWRRRG